MKKHKKIIALLVAIMFVFSMAVPAFAGETRFADVKGTDLSRSIERLANLEILQGYPDGTFRPENNITRAEFAAVAVRALGLDIAAQSSAGATMFSDVPAGHWAAGFVNVAAQQGVINGYPDGTFRPNANVTHAEALAMMVRLLGYSDTTIGTWPTKYLVRAAQLGITKDVVVVANAQATRGEVAMVVNNALDTPMWVIAETEQGRQIWREGATLLERSLRVIKVESAIVTNTPLFDDSLNANEVRLAAGNVADGTGIYYRTGSSTPDRIAAGRYVINVPNLDARQLMIGQEIDIWVRDANRDGQLQSNENVVIALESVSEVVTGFVREVKDGRVELKDGSRHILNNGATRIIYNLDNSASAIFTYTGNDTALDNSNPDTGLSIKNAYVSILKDSNNRVATISALQNAGRHGNSLIVDTVNASKQELRVMQPSSTSTSRIDLERFKVHVNKNGKFVNFADLKEGDVVNIYESPSGATLILATDDTAEGKFVRVDTGGISNMGTIVLSDKNVPVARVAGFRETGRTSVSATTVDLLAGFANNDVKIKLNAFGQAVFVEGARTTTSTDVVVISTERFAGSLSHGKIKVFTMEGEEVVYEFRNATVADQFHTLVAGGGPQVGMRQVITLSLNTAGRVDTGSVLNPATDGNLTRIDKDNNRIQFGGATFRNADSNTKIVDATSANSSDWKVYTWEQFKSTPNPDAAVTVATTYKVDSNNVLDYVVIRTVTVPPGATPWVISAGDEMFGIITARSQAGTDHFVTVNVQGTVTTYKATGNHLATVPNGSAIEFRLNAKGELDSSAAITVDRDTTLATHPHVRTINTSARTLQLEAAGGATTWYTLAEDVQVFDNTTLVSLADLEASTTNRNDATKVSVLTSSNPNHAGVVKVIIIQQKPVVAGPGPVLGTQTVTHINAAGNIILGSNDYTISATTILRNEAGTVIAVGPTAINTALNAGDTVRNVVVQNGVVISLVGVSVASETAAANIVIGLLDAAAMNPLDAGFNAGGEVAAARAAYNALTASQKNLVTNYAKLTVAEAAVIQLTITNVKTQADAGTLTTAHLDAVTGLTYIAANLAAYETAIAAAAAGDVDTVAKLQTVINSVNVAEAAAALQAAVTNVKTEADAGTLTTAHLDAVTGLTYIAANLAAYETAIAAAAAGDVDTVAKLQTVINSVNVAEAAAAALSAVNAATTTLQMRTALVNNASVLNISVTGSFVGNENAVADEMLAVRPGGGFASVAAVKAAFDAIIAGL